MKKILSVLLAVMMLVGALSVSADVLVGMPNPMNEYESIEALIEDYRGIEMAEPPAGSENVSIYAIDSGNGSPIAQIVFTNGGAEYTYRAYMRDEEEEPVYNADTGYLPGLYYNFDVDRVEAVTAGDISYNMHILYYTPENVGAAIWYDTEAGCEYSVAAAASLDAIKAMASELAYMNDSYSEVGGTVLASDGSTLTLRVPNGSVIVFALPFDYSVIPGDYVMLAYTGAAGVDATIVNIDVLYDAHTFSGTVTAHDKDTVSVKAKNGTLLKFNLLEYTTITGNDTAIKNNAQVTVTYAGDLAEAVYAYEVSIDVAGSELDPKLIDKTLSGTVTKLKTGSFQVKMKNGKKYSFKRTAETEYTGKYKIAVGCTVTVTYDGYASDTPDAKIVKVTAKKVDPTPDPTPKPVKLKTAKGTVTTVCGIWIGLDDGQIYTVNSAECNIKGGDFLEPGAYAVIKYYKDGNERIAREATFELLVY